MKNVVQNYIGSLLLLALFTACSKEVNPNNEQGINAASKPGGPNKNANLIFVSSNDAGANHILTYAQSPNGSLRRIFVATSGGKGSGSALGSQGAIQLSDDKRWLFTVNAGDNTISSFSVEADGVLLLSSTVSSNGVLPVSLTVHGNRLYVVNATSASISGYTIGAKGELTYIEGSNQQLSSTGAAPGQISFTPSGEYLIVTERMTNRITSFPVNTIGVPEKGISLPTTNTNPMGFGFSGDHAIVAHRSAGGNSVICSYKVGSGLQCGPISATQTAASRVVVSRDGGFAFVVNTGTNTISLYRVDNNGIISLVHDVEASTGMAPSDIVFDSDEGFAYTINTFTQTITGYKKSPNSALRSIGEVASLLPPNATGLAAY